MAIYLGNQMVGINNITTASGGGSGVNVSQLDVSINGTYTASSGNAYSPVVVNVQPTLKMGAIRPDATLVKTWSYDYNAVEDLEITLPTYSTSAQTVRASEALSPTYTIDYDNYWYILERFLTIPTYSISTIAKGRVEYHIGSCAYELVEVPAGTFPSLIEPSKYYTTVTRAFYATGAYYRSLYYSSGTTLTAYSTSVYTTAQTVAAPSISNGVVTINTPTWSMRGSTTYFVNTFWNAITDIRYQFIAELYKVPKSSLNVNGWGIGSQTYQIIDCVKSANKKLT